MALDPKKAQEYAKANKDAAQSTKDNAEAASDLRDRLRDVLYDTRDFADSAKEAAKAVFNSNIAASEVAKSFRDVASAAKGITDRYADVLTGEKDFQSLLRDREKLQNAQKSFNTEYEQFLKEVITDQETINGILAGTIDPYDALDANLENVTEDAFRLLELYQLQNDQLAEEADNMAEIAQRAQTIDEAMRPLGDKAIGLQDAAKGLSDGLNKAGLGDLGGKLGIDDALSGTKKMAAEMTKGGTQAMNMSGKMQLAGNFAKTLGQNLMKSLGPAALLAMAVEQIVKAFKLIDNQSGEVAKNFGISAEEGRKLVSSSSDAAAMSGDLLTTTKDIVAAQTSLNKQFGTSVQFSGELATEFAHVQERAGLSAETMGKLAENSMITGESIMSQLEAVQGVTMEMSAQSGIMLNQKDIQEGLKEVSNAQRLINKFNTEELAKQVFQTKLLGVSQSQLESMGSKLLDFESSIAAEMEAELLTGKQLNLEGARQAALMGDQATLAAELRKEVGSAAEFGEMNVLQQEALAKAVGLTRDQMADMLVEQEKLQAIQGAGFKSLSDAQEQYNQALKDGNLTEELKLKLQKAGVLNQMESATAQEKLNAAMEKITDLFVQIMDPLMPVFDALLAVLNPIFAILSPILKLVGDLVGLIVGALKPAFDAITLQFQGIADFWTGVFNLDFDMMITGIKKIGKSILDLVLFPFETLIGWLNYIPGVDIPLPSQLTSELVGLAEGGVVTSPTTALIGEGGEPEAVVPLSKAKSMGFGGDNRETNALLRELISLMKQGGIVTLDGQKVGQAMMLGSYQLQ